MNLKEKNLTPFTLDIWKYPLYLNESTFIKGCIGKVLDVQLQDSVPCMWAMVNPEGVYNKYEIIPFVTGTNYVADGEYLYIGTVQVGLFVIHYFMREIQE